ncbi:MAG TPA: hypothetical protein VN700_10800 [Vicinamibacterales bacterium]|nr:hypothetical protein [Vicinamibacterales bacterium]
MRWLASRRGRIFVVAWMFYSLHFATNVVREHYPAFSIAQHGTFRVDEYQGFHADIFVHKDGHAVIGNQVFVSMLAAVPLFVFNPVLDRIEAYSKAKIASEGVPAGGYRIDKPNRQKFFQLVKERGLDLRFGAATAVTSVFFMAPITAAFLVFFYGVLLTRGLEARTATGLTFLLGFGTPLFFRTSTLNHNLFVMYAMFIAFVLLWLPSRGLTTFAEATVVGRSLARRPKAPGSRRFWAGFFGGITLATDYVGVIILPLLWIYFVVTRARASSWRTALSESTAIVLGTLPPIAFLLYSQWSMYGNPFLPGQYWMPNQNVFVDVGARGWTLPDPQLFLMNLFDPSFGMYVWAPILLLALVPVRRYRDESLILPRPERRWLAVTWVAFLVFASSNQYSRLQFNSGFRYLVPLVPFLMLALADHWVRLPRGWRAGVAGVAMLHAWVLTVFREPVGQSWRMFLAEGPQLPWYRVLGLTSSPDNPWLGTWLVPTLLMALTAAIAAGFWRLGDRWEQTHGV